MPAAHGFYSQKVDELFGHQVWINSDGVEVKVTSIGTHSDDNKRSVLHSEHVGELKLLVKMFNDQKMKYGYFSKSAEKFGSSLYVNPDGDIVTVTCVDEESTNNGWYKFQDVVEVGPVVYHIGNLAGIEEKLLND